MQRASGEGAHPVPPGSSLGRGLLDCGYTDDKEEGFLWEVPALCAGQVGTPELFTNASLHHRREAVHP